MYVVGETGILEELDLKGISYIGGPADADKKVELKPGYFLEQDKDVMAWGRMSMLCCVVLCSVIKKHDQLMRFCWFALMMICLHTHTHTTQVGAVVVGFDRHINYHKIQYATLCIRENPGCLFLATNLDAVTHLTDAQEWAGNGSMVGAIRGM